MDRNEEFARKLNLLLDNRGMQQVELAAKMEVDKTLINKYCKGRRLPTLKQIQKMGEIFNVTTDYLLSLDEENMAPCAKTIPIYNTIQSGRLANPKNTVSGEESISEELSAKGELFALSIQDDSMAPRFMKGDVAIVRRQPYANDGDIAVVLNECDDAVVRLYKQRHDRIDLEAFNHAYHSFSYTNDEIAMIPVIILGVVVELRARKFN